MKTISRAVRLFLAAAVLSAGLAARAEATSIDLVSTASAVNPGDSFSIDVYLNGWGIAIGSAGFTLNYSSLVTGTTFDTNPDNAMGPDAGPDAIVDISCAFSTSGACSGSTPFDYFVSTGYVLPADEATLFAAQNSGVSFRIARVNFTAGPTPGSVAFTLGPITLTDYNANVLDDFADNGVTVRINDIQPPPPNDVVPEPTSMLLLGTGLGSLVMRRRRQQKQ